VAKIAESSAGALPGVSFEEARHRLAGQKGITLPMAGSQLGGSKSPISTVSAPKIGKPMAMPKFKI
jgi:hypothetical protein